MKHNRVSKCLLLILSSSLPFIFNLNGDFVFDDSEAIVKNQDVISDSFKNVFYNDFWGTDIRNKASHKSYRPLTVLSFRLNYHLSGEVLNAQHFKITNLISHTICCILIWITLNEITKQFELKNDNVAYLSTLLFAVHPVHVEAVSGIVGRADILSAIFFFPALYCYIKATESKKSAAILLCITDVCATLSMFFKENGITVLGVCIMYDIIKNLSIKKTKMKPENSNKKLVLRIIIISLSILLLLGIRWYIMGGTYPQFKSIDNPAAFSDSYFSKVASYNYVYFLNFLLLFWPQWLCYDWSMGCVPLIKELNDYRLIFVILMYLYGILILRWTYTNRLVSQRLQSFAVVILVVPFLPASNIFFPVGFVVAERILYTSCLGFCILVVLGFQKLHNVSGKGMYKKLTTSLLWFLLITYSVRCHERSRQWRDEYSLFNSGVDVCPLNAKVRYNVAKVADVRGQTELAVKEYNEAIRLYPEYYQAMNNLANLYKEHGKYQEAEILLNSALKYKLDFPAAWMNLGIVLAIKKRYNESHQAYLNALKYRHKYPDCYYNLGNLFLEMKDYSKAVEAWQVAIQMNPKHALAWSNLLALLDNTEKLSDALEIIPEALQELPESPSVHFAIANIYGKSNLYEKAEEHFHITIELFGNKVHPKHYTNLGVLYHRWKKYEKARQMYNKALQLDPGYSSALSNLERLNKINDTK